MVEKEAAGSEPARVVAPRIAAAFSDAELALMFPGVRIVHSTRTACSRTRRSGSSPRRTSDARSSWLGMSLAGNPDLGRRAIAWLGISPQEIPEREGKLDFAWAARFGHASPGDVAYFVPQDLTAAQRGFCDSRKIAYVEPADTFCVLPMQTRFRVLGAAFSAFLGALALPGLIGPFVARLHGPRAVLGALFTELGTTTYVTTTSYSWPEKPELAVASARGIRSIIWAVQRELADFHGRRPGLQGRGRSALDRDRRRILGLEQRLRGVA